VHRATYDWLLISQGSTANYAVRTVVRETVDGAGNADATVEQWSADCRGRG
jgi:hypothetical protein